MGKKDVITTSYMSKPEYFADAFNYFVFDGKQIVQSDMLNTEDPSELSIIFQNDKVSTTKKLRDVLKHCVVMQDKNYTYLILGIENQSDIHYAMPVKNMIYDALNYGKQVSEKAREHRVTKDIKVNLLIPKEISDFSKFKTDFGKAMHYISLADDFDMLNEYINSTPTETINTDTALLLRECTGIEIPDKEGGTNMEVCKAWTELQERNRREGRLETLFDLVSDNLLTLSNAAEKALMSEEDFAERMKKAGY